MPQEISFWTQPSSLPYLDDNIIEVRSNKYIIVNNGGLKYDAKSLVYISNLYGLFTGFGTVILSATITKPGNEILTIISQQVTVSSGSSGTAVTVIPKAIKFPITHDTRITVNATTTGSAEWYGYFNSSLTLIFS